MKTIAFLFCAALCLNGESPKPRIFAVGVSVASDDVALRARLQSCIGRHLRELGDVKIVTERPEVILELVAAPSLLQSGEQAGYAISIVSRMVQPNSPYDHHAGLEVIHDLHLFAVAEFEQVCSTMVAMFDQENLEPLRKP